MIKKRRAFGVFVVTVALVVGPAAFVAFAKGRTSHATSTFEVVNVDPTDTANNYGDTVTFTVDTNQTTRPFVGLTCYQGDDLVYAKSAGFFDDYMFSNTYTLSSSWWSGGAADCSANLYYFTTTGRERSLGTLTFPVAA